jgi:Flp pilus assembly protein TadG
MERTMMRGAGFASARRGQSTVEFAFIAIVLVGLLLAVIDLGRAGYVQHSLDRGAADLAQRLAGISGTTTSGSPYVYTPPPLDPTSTGATTYTVYEGISKTVPLAMQAALDHARAVAGGAFSAATLVPPAGSFVPNVTTTITNTQVTVVGTPSLTAPTEITVTVTAPFTPVVGLFLGNKILRLRSTEAAIPVAGQTAS